MYSNGWPRYAPGPVPTGHESQRRKIKRTDGGSRFSLDPGHLDDFSVAEQMHGWELRETLRDVFPKPRLGHTTEVMFGSFDPPVPAPPDQSHSASSTADCPLGTIYAHTYAGCAKSQAISSPDTNWI